MWVPSTRRGRRSADSPASASASSSQSSVCQVAQPGAGSRPVVDEQLARERVQHELLDAAPPAHRRERLRLALTPPHELRERRHRVHRRPGAAGEHGVAQTGRLLGGAVVGPREQRRHGRGVRVEPDEAVHRAAQREPGDGAAGRCDRLADRIERSGDDRLGLGRRRGAALTDDRPVRGHRERLRARRADVDADDDRVPHAHSQQAGRAR